MSSVRFRRRRAAHFVGIVALATAACLPAHATDSAIAWSRGMPQTVAGTLGSGDGTMHRLRQSCGELSNTGTAVYYDTVRVTNVGSEPSRLDVRTQPPGGDGTAMCTDENADTVMAVYIGPFSPAAAPVNCLAFNDDSAAPNLDRCSRIPAFTLLPGEEATVVVMGFDNGDSFAYDLRFDGSVFGHHILRADFEDDDAPELHSQPVGGGFTLQGYPIPMAADSHFNGQVDEAGAIDGSFALGATEVSDIATHLGLVTLRSQFWHAGASAGLIDPDDNAALNVSQMWFRLQSVTIDGVAEPIGGDCAFGPIFWTLAGSADASLIDVLTPSFTMPPMPADACNGYGTMLNGLISGNNHGVRLLIDR